MNQEPGSFHRAREALGDYRCSVLEERIAQITKDDGASVQILGEIIAAEPLLAARVLTLASRIPGLPQSSFTLPQLLTFVGLHEVKTLALALALFAPAPDGEAEDGTVVLRQLWEHSLGCAILAGRSAVKIGNVSSQLAFLAGLVHDVGRLLLYRHSEEQYVKSAAVAREKNIPLTEAEMLAAGFNHLELGEYWCEKMALHRALGDVIRYHHEPHCMLPDSMAAEVRQTLAVVQLADLACEDQGIGSGGEGAEEKRELWSSCSFQGEKVADEVSKIKRELEASRQIFGFGPADYREASLRQRSAASSAAPLISPAKSAPANARRGQVIPFPTRSDASPKPGAYGSSKRLTILVVEDHGSLCEMLSLYLMRYGYHVRTADNGETALDLLAKEAIDVVLLDLMLPRLDGFSVLKCIRGASADTKPYVIIISAGASEKDRNRVLELGANEYMPKPFHLSRLLERIRAVEQYLIS